MSREIYDIVNDMVEVLNALQMQKLQEVLVKRMGAKLTDDNTAIEQSDKPRDQLL